MNPPAIDRAVHTTPPIIIAAAIPPFPLRPTATSTRAVIISVIMVIPLTGFEPTIAMALAATVVKRNEMTATIRSPIRACQMLSTTPPKAKKAKMASRVMMTPTTTIFIDKSLSFSSTAVCAPDLRENSPTARPTALFMTPALFIMPIIPAVAMPPMPICLAYSLKIISGDISPTVCAMPVPIRSMTWFPKSRFIPGMITSQTRNEPQQMMNAYFKPTMYPRPSTAAPVFNFKTTFALSATTWPKCVNVVLMVSAQAPNVEMTKSYNPPMRPAVIRVLVLFPPSSPLIST